MFFGYFLNIKKVTPSADFVIGPAKAEAFLFSHTRLPFPPRPLLPFGRISLRETARPVIGPTGADVLACLAFALLKRGPPAKTPALLVFNSVFAARKPAGASPRFRTAGR